MKKQKKSYVSASQYMPEDKSGDPWTHHFENKHDYFSHLGKKVGFLATRELRKHVASLSEKDAKDLDELEEEVEQLVEGNDVEIETEQ